MEKRKELIDYILKNGKTHTWYELALKFNIRPGKNRKERTKAANDVWRGYERTVGNKTTSTFNHERFKNVVEELFTDKQSFITKSALDAAKSLWKTLPDSLQPKSVEALEEQIEIVKQLQSDFRKAKVFKLSKEQENLIDIYNEIVDQKDKERRKLFFDIETSPNLVTSWRVGNKINIPAEAIVKERAIICISYKWSDEDKVTSIAWNKGDDKDLLIEFSKIIESADEIVTQNGDRFDVKWIRTRCMFHDIPFPIKFNSIDTLKLAKASFYLNSNRLDYMGKFLGVGQKNHTSYELWSKIIFNNDKQALQEMMDYCNQDVLLLEEVYNKFKKYCPTKRFKYIDR
jgi:uncharacterized protein YprB with RNaseH-like and TPR domain